MAHFRDTAAFALSVPVVAQRVGRSRNNAKPLFNVARTRQCRVRAPRDNDLSMSGVNGGIDYEIDLEALPEALASRVRAIQVGPDSPLELIAAATDIAAAAPTTPETLPVLVDMLGYNNPVAARIAVDALVQAGKKAVPPLLTGVGAFNYAVNAYALRALAGVGDPSVAAVCTACAKRGPIPGVRRAACAALAALKFDNVDEAIQAYEVLLRIADGETDWGVRYAAVVGIERFACAHLLSDALRTDGVRVLEGILNDVRVFPVDSSDDDTSDEPRSNEAVKRDLTVVARATVALELLRGAPIPV